MQTQSDPVFANGLRILHVEDSPQAAELIREVLIGIDAGIEVDWAPNQQVCGEFLHSCGYDLIICDYQLPGFDAPAVLELVHAICPQTPFICVSGAIGEEKAVDLLKLGATDYVSKTKLERLPMVLRRALAEVQEREARQLAVTALQHSEARYHSLIQTAMDGFWLVDRAGYLREVNDTYCAMSGYSALQLLTMHVIDLEAAESASETTEHLRKMSQTGQDRYESRHRRKDGSVFHVEISSQFRPDQGGYFTVFIQNITERKQAQTRIQELNQELEQRVQVRTQELKETIAQSEKMHEALVIKEKIASLTPLVAAVSHELNTPIGNILVLSSALQERYAKIAPNFPDRISQIELGQFLDYLENTNQLLISSATFAATLVHSFKQIAVDRQGEQRHDFSLRLLAEDCLCLVALNFKHSPIQLINEVPADLKLLSYPGALGQVIENLVRNAYIHAFPDGCPGQIRIGAKLKGAAPEIVGIEVSDNGTGIPPAHRQKIFDPFFTTHLGAGGSGLGLSIVYNLVNKVLGGSIRVESSSTEDKTEDGITGTRFRLEILRELKAD